MSNTIREQISEILVKWSMPTRQAAISELLSLFEQMVMEAKPDRLAENTWCEDDDGFNCGIDQYESNLLSLLKDKEEECTICNKVQKLIEKEEVKISI